MSKPILKVTIRTIDGKKEKIPALLDSGSFYTIVNLNSLPSAKAMLPYKVPEKLTTAQKKSKVTIVGETVLIITIAKKMIRSHALVASDLSREMIIGAETMQAWDITIKNHKGKTKVVVSHDMRQPDITEVA